ncbi:MAG: RNA polymerase subunit sigma-24 [Myxococcales bacterium]|nr:RNA polymerase subunit sigma-24 [Myxococcales bacterium]
MEPARALVDLVRGERTRLVATLVRSYGFDLAEESIDAAIEAALEQWPVEGPPASPRAWLLSVARRRAIDAVRHRVTAAQVHDALALVVDEAIGEEEGARFPDDRLRLVFTCCHPAIARDAQVALALRWISGLSTEEIARAFLVPVPTMAQRLTRAKSKIEAARIPYEVPEARELPERLSAVLEVTYAIFNEGYVATAGSVLQRVDLAEEALRLGELLVMLLPDAEAKALLALLWLVHARRAARCTAEGDLVPLEEQDRTAWDRAAIARGKALLAEALATGAPTAYAIEAAIQALHDDASSFAATDFRQILALYGMLRARTEAPIVALNEAVARAMVEGPARALADVEVIEASGVLGAHHAVPAAKADLLRRLGRVEEARAAYDAAIAAAKNEVERRFLTARRAALS